MSSRSVGRQLSWQCMYELVGESLQRCYVGVGETVRETTSWRIEATS